MKKSTEISLRISKLTSLKQKAERNAKRIRKHGLTWHNKNNYIDHWLNLAANYQKEINQLKQS